MFKEVKYAVLKMSMESVPRLELTKIRVESPVGEMKVIGWYKDL
jgi:hypothetical protein